MLSPTIFTDTYSDSKSFGDGQAELVMDECLMGATCLLLASKFYEIDDNLIMISDLQKEMKNVCTLPDQDILRTEIEILNRFNWNLLYSLPLDFV